MELNIQETSSLLIADHDNRLHLQPIRDHLYSICECLLQELSYIV